MEDGTGHVISRHDLVMLIRSKAATTAHNYHRGGACAKVLRSLPDRKIVVQRVDGAEATEHARDLAVVDRSFLHPGTVVAAASDGGGGQLGVVTAAATAVDLLSGDGGKCIAFGVSPAELRRVRELCLGDYVVAAGQRWLGRVVEVSLDVDVLFDGGGAVCRVSRAGSKLMTVDKDCLNRRTNSCFYPGQRVVDGVGGAFKTAQWLKGYWKRSYSQGTVSKVQIATVLVHWVATSSSSSSPPPAHLQHPEDLTFFGPGDELNSWTVGDLCFFRSGGGKVEELLLERPMTVAATCTVVDVVWQDGTRQRRVPSTSLINADAQDGHDFFPGQRVVVRAPTDDRVGLVRSFSCEDQTVRVAWAPAAAAETMECSAYDLGVNSPDDAFYGDIAVRRQPIMDGGDDLSWVGQIVDLLCDDDDDGHDLRVKWGDGTTSNVPLHEVAVVKQCGVGEMLEQIRGQAPRQDIIVQATARVIKLVQAVFRLISKVRAQCRAYLVSAIMVDPPPSSSEEDVGAEDDSNRQFPQFDVVQSPSDHHFLDSKREHEGTGCGRRKWTRRVSKEWQFLKDHLPAGTIYARAFEDRMDLLRVAMVGACGTPYHDGLFFFDLHLPPSYPDEPPQVSYRSFGLRVNPNLYESGTVCLSLLNTFGGDASELWSPDTSTILQVLVSIQGLVLTAQPYYNEAGYEVQAGTPEGRRNELPYSEKAYLLTLQTMMHLMRHPPMGFEDLVGDHFRRRGQHVLRACQAYLESACLVGSLDAEENPATEASSVRPCSAGFRLAIANIVPRLYKAFINIGAQGCEQFNRLLQVADTGHSVC